MSNGALDPLLVTISIHVEGWNNEAELEQQFQKHRDGLLTLAADVADGGGVLTFELSDAFMDAVEVRDDDVLSQFLAMGHSVAVHADEGGRGVPSLRDFTRSLTRKRTQLELLGVETNHVSGICSKGPWVEAALEAGFSSTNGAVAYCAAGMDSELLSSDALWVLDCASPGDCHGPAPVTDDRRYHPFHATSSSDWMVSDATGGLLVIVSESGSSLACLDESGAGQGGCTANSADLAVLAPVIDEYLVAREPGRVTALSYSWSIGAIPDAGFGTELAAVFASHVASGDVVWVGTDEIEAYADLQK